MAIETKDKLVTVEGLGAVYSDVQNDINNTMSLYIERGLPYTSGWSGAVYGGGKFVVASSNKVAYSSDGLSWTGVELSYGISNPRIKYLGSRYVIYSKNGKDIYYSTNGSSWSRTSCQFNIAEIYYNGGICYIVGSNLKVCTTTDFTSFSDYSNTSYSGPFEVSFVGGRLIALSQAEALYSTNNGTTWSYGTISGSIRSTPVGVVYSNGILLSADSTGYTLTSSNMGQAWNVVGQKLPSGLNSLISVGGFIFATRTTSGAYPAKITVSSYINVSYTNVQLSGSGANLRTIAYGNGVFVAPGYGTNSFAYGSSPTSWVIYKDLSRVEQSGQDVSELVSEALGIPDIIGDISTLTARVTPINKGGTGATTAEDALVNLGITATAEELNYITGVTSGIQEQLDEKVDNSTFEQAMQEHNHDDSYYSKSGVDSAIGGHNTTSDAHADLFEAKADQADFEAAVARIGTNEGLLESIQEQLDEKIPFGGGQNFTDGDDLNNYRTPGVWISGSASDSQLLLNAPTKLSGFKLFVIDGYISGRVTHFATTNNRDLFYRQSNASTWSEWVNLSNIPAAETAGGAAMSAISDKNGLQIDRMYQSLVANGTAIPSGADLGQTAYLKVGSYYCTNNTIAASLIGAPTATAFKMEVFSPISNEYDNETTDTYVYRVRRVTTYKGAEFIQYITSSATAGEFTFFDWERVFNSGDTIPISNGGTGQDFKEAPNGKIPANAVIRNSSDDSGFWYTQSGNGALYSTGTDKALSFGTLPIAQGGTGATTAREALNNLGGISRTLLWQNASPSSQFVAQSIELFIDGYDAIEVIFFDWTPSMISSGVNFNTSRFTSSGMVPCSPSGSTNNYSSSSAAMFTEALNFAIREFNIRPSTGYIVFNDAHTNNSSDYVDNEYMIPYRIYGIRW